MKSTTGNATTKKRRTLRMALALCGALAFSGLVSPPANAAVIVDTDAGTLHTTAGLTGFSTDGADMVGMLVTAFFGDLTSQAISWAATGAVSGSASGTGWSLSESGDTFGTSSTSGVWTLSNSTGKAVSRLLVEGPPGNTIFDINGSTTGTAGSGLGRAFTLVAGPAGPDITATYRDLVAIGSTAPVGDLFARLDLQFTSAGLFGSGSTLQFRTDTDNAATAGDIVPVPEPASLLLLGLGALVALGARRRYQA